MSLRARRQAYAQVPSGCIRPNRKPSENIVNQLIGREHFSSLSSRAGVFKHKKFSNPLIKLRLRNIFKSNAHILNSHVFMGFTICCQYLVSWRCIDRFEYNSRSNFFLNYQYELFLWPFHIHKRLNRFHRIKLFSNDLLPDMNRIKIVQWPNNPRLLVIYGIANGSSDTDNVFLTVISVPKMGCADCFKINRNRRLEHTMELSKCLQCSYVVNTKFTEKDAHEIYNSLINLNCPEHIVVATNGFLHSLELSAVMPKPTIPKSTCISSRYIPQLKSTGHSVNIVDRIINDFSDVDTTQPTIMPSTKKHSTGTPIKNQSVTTGSATKANRIRVYRYLLDQDCAKSTLGQTNSAYEFQDETELPVKLSIFRKRCLAEKKYALNEENLENIPCPIDTRSLLTGGFKWQKPSGIESENVSPASNQLLEDNSTNTDCQSASEPMDIDQPKYVECNIRYYLAPSDNLSSMNSDGSDDDYYVTSYHNAVPLEVGYRTSRSELQMEMSTQIVPNDSEVSRLKVVQRTFDLDSFAYNVAKQLCELNNKTYLYFYDMDVRILHVCPLTSTLTCSLKVHFHATEQRQRQEYYHCDCREPRFNCDCFKRHSEGNVIFSWNLETGSSMVNDYGELHRVWCEDGCVRIRTLDASRKLPDVSKAIVSQNHTMNYSENEPLLVLTDYWNAIQIYRD